MIQSSVECYLHCADSSHPDIPLPHLVPVSVGRGSTTKIKDGRCSRNQLSIIADTESCTVQVLQKGVNNSTVEGKEIGHDNTVTALHKNSIEILTGAYPHYIIFNPPPPEKAVNPPVIERPAKKRSAENIDNGGAKMSKIEKCTWRDVPWMKGGAGKVILVDDEVEWKSVDNNTVLIRTEQEVKGKTKVAAFDIDGTIITTQSGRVFPKDIDDWRIIYPEVPGHLKQLIKDGFKIVFITNQSGIAKGKMTVDGFRLKISRIREKLGVPLQVFCSTGDGFFRKPRPGIWWWLEKYGNGGVTIDRSQSFYCGDAAGREAGWQSGKKKDFSCSDRLFALNLGLKFVTPEEEFLKQKATSKFNLPSYLPGPSTLSLLEPTDTKLIWTKQMMVIMVGIQGSGKSVIAELMEREGCLVASNDRTGSRDKSVRVAEQALVAGRSVVVDNTHVDKESRKPFIDLAAKYKIPVRCFMMATTHDHARHNNIYRELTDPTHARIKEPLFNQYRSRFVAPTLDEGFQELIKVNIVPKFDTKENEELYYMHLLEK